MQNTKFRQKKNFQPENSYGQLHRFVSQRDWGPAVIYWFRAWDQYHSAALSHDEIPSEKKIEPENVLLEWNPVKAKS